MFEGKVKVRYRASRNKSETITGTFQSLVPFYGDGLMICLDVGKVWRMIPLEIVISIDIISPKKTDDDSEETDVMVG